MALPAPDIPGTQPKIPALTWREFGPWFALRSAVTCWMIYLLSGLGSAGRVWTSRRRMRGEVEEVEPAP